ncbi:MAG TPA: hypothetical protein VLJ60_00260 [bacterium]|nr:hypothetical protein [bacterium]
MKKILVLIIVTLLTLTVFAEEKIVFSKEAQETIKYLETYGIDYEITYEFSKELPKEGRIFNVENVQTFLSSVAGTKSLLTHVHYAFAGIVAPYIMPVGQKLVLAGGLETTGYDYDGFKYKWERYATYPFAYWGSVTKSRHCPGGSGDTTVSYCTQTDNDETTMYADYSEYTFCTTCGNSAIFRIQYAVNLYTTTYIRTWNGMFWVWLPVTVYAGWQYTLTAGTPPPPFSPVSNICSTPVNLVTLCPYI